MEKLYESLGISRPVADFAGQILARLEDRFRAIDEVAEYNQLKVIKAMQDARVSAECFNSSTGYGYNDMGRDTLEVVYANAFHTEAALVRPQITCGTHALRWHFLPTFVREMSFCPSPASLMILWRK